MKALVFDGSLRVADVPPEGHEDDVLIRTRVAGICATDLEITRGYRNFHGVLGHEFVGEVVECADASWIGRRVCGEINIGCGRCEWCALDTPEHCRNRTVLGIAGRQGAFADLVSLPLANLHAIPDELGDDEAVFIEPLAAAFEILEQVRVAPQDRVAVLGDGKLGLLCAQVMKTAAGSVTVVGRHARKLELARGFGLVPCGPADARPEQVDIVVEATGSSAGLVAAIAMARPRGTIVLKTTVAESVTIDVSAAVVKELTLIGSRCGPFPKAIEALRRHQVSVIPLIDARFPLDQGVEAFERAATPGVLKVLIDFG